MCQVLWKSRHDVETSVKTIASALTIAWATTAPGQEWLQGFNVLCTTVLRQESGREWLYSCNVLCTTVPWQKWLQNCSWVLTPMSTQYLQETLSSRPYLHLQNSICKIEHLAMIIILALNPCDEHLNVLTITEFDYLVLSVWFCFEIYRL